MNTLRHAVREYLELRRSLGLTSGPRSSASKTATGSTCRAACHLQGRWVRAIR